MVGHRKSRSFLLERKVEKHRSLQGLIDARVVHLVHRGYIDPLKPSHRYNIYTLDYGTYVDLIETSHTPEGYFIFGDFIPEDMVVPFKDKRGMRKIILREGILDLV